MAAPLAARTRRKDGNRAARMAQTPPLKLCPWRPKTNKHFRYFKMFTMETTNHELCYYTKFSTVLIIVLKQKKENSCTNNIIQTMT